MSLSASQTAVIKDQAHNVAIAVAAIGAAFGWTQGQNWVVAVDGIVAAVFSVLSSFHVASLFNVN